MTDKELLSALSDMLDTKLTPIREDLEGLKAETGEIKADVDGIKAEVGGLKAEVGGLKAEVIQLKQDVAELRDITNLLNIRVGNLEKDFAVLKR